MSTEVKRRACIGREDGESGIIIRLTKVYTGYADKGLWEWLADSAP